MPLVEIKDFNALIDNTPLFHQAVKSKQEGYEKIIEMSKNDIYTTENLLGFSYHQNCYKSLVQIYQDKQMQVFLNKLILQKNQMNMMVQQYFLLLKSSKKPF